MDIAAVTAELTPTGVLRAGINMGNGLLVTGRTAEGEPDGVSPEMARALAARLGVELRLVPFARPDQAGEAAGDGTCDICLIGAEPARAVKVAFTAAYAEIEATYLVPAGSGLGAIDEVDRPGVRIVVAAGSAYGHWLERNVAQAELIRAGGAAEAVARFKAEGLDALAALKTQLLVVAAEMPGARILPGRFTAVQQAIGTGRGNEAAAGFLRGWVEEAKSSGLVAGLIAKHGVTGLSVAPMQEAAPG